MAKAKALIVFGAGKTIVVVVAVLGFFNSLGTDGSFGNEDTSNSVLSKASQVVTPVLEPIGVKADNFVMQQLVSLLVFFAKEAVVGTLNSLYAPATDDSNEEYNLVASLKEAVQSLLVIT